MFYFCCSLTCLVFTLGFMGGKKFIQLLSLIMSVRVPVPALFTCLFPFLHCFPSCTSHSKVALCAAGPIYAPCMKPRGQAHVCKSVWHSKTYHSTSAHAHCLSLLTHSSFPWHYAVTFTSNLTPVASSSLSTTQFLNSLCAVGLVCNA